MKNFILFGIAVLSFFGSFAQKIKNEKKAQKQQKIRNMVREEEEGIISYKKQFVFGAHLSTDGYGIMGEFGKFSSVKKSMLFQLDIGEKKDAKEDKSYGTKSIQPYIYGKQNFVYPIKLGVQLQTLLGNKSNKNGVSISANYGGGLSIALLRPYMVQIVNSTNELEYIKYSPQDSATFLDEGAVVKGPQFGTGWNQMTVKPGAYAKAAIRFDYGAYNETVSALEAGIMGEIYSGKIPIMVNNPAKQFFFTGYVTILFGRRK
ncbi:hypothetical protein BH09BAC2_BH09BAC2_08890 [soil metagenome]